MAATVAAAMAVAMAVAVRVVATVAAVKEEETAVKEGREAAKEVVQSTCGSHHRTDTHSGSNDGQRPSCRCTYPDSWVGSAPAGKPRSKPSHPPHRCSSCRPRRPSGCWCSSRQASPRGSHPREAGSAGSEAVVTVVVATVVEVTVEATVAVATEVELEGGERCCRR